MEFNQIYNMGCLDGIDLLADGCVDFVFADLPYGMTQNKWDSIIDFDGLWSRLNRVCKSNAAMVFTAMQPFTSKLVISNLTNFKYEAVWVKNKSTGFLNAKKQPLRIHENVVVFYREQPAYNPQMTVGKKPVNSYTKHSTDGANYGKTKLISGGGSTTRYPTTILEIPVINNDNPEKFHPNQKPVSLVEYFINTYTGPGDLVLDPTAGSGTALVAAKRLGRRYIGYETDLDTFNKAKARIEAA
jgi:site-specific DNA-methyltransferase (adenine-specific)